MAASTDKLKGQLTNQNNAPQKQQPAPDKTIQALLKRMQPEIERALPQHLTPERMGRIALTAVRQNPKLMACDQTSLLAAVMQSAQLGLEPNTPLGEAYIIPYGKEAQFQVGYKGLIALAHRSGEYKAIYAHSVDKNDEFHFEYGLEKNLIHKPSPEPSGEITHYYGVYKLKNGGYDFAVSSIKQIQAHAQKYSQAYAKGWTSPWKSDFDSMALKTVLKMALKYAPKSIEFARQVESDETVKKEISDDMTSVQPEYIDVEVTEEENTNE